MRQPAGKAYTELVAIVAKAFDPTANVRTNEWVEGPDGRLDMDVSIRGMLDGRETLAFIECKDYDLATTGKVGRPIIDALDSKRDDLGSDITFICSNSGFTEDALNKARRKGIIAVSVVAQGDERIKLVIKQEIYWRLIQLFPIENRYIAVGNIGPVANKELKYQGLPIDDWLLIRAINIAMSNPQVSQPIIGTFTFKQPTEFELGDRGTVTLEKLQLRFTPKTKWFSQIVEIDAKLGMYDYLRGRIKLTPGHNSYSIKGLDFDEARPLESPPDLEPLKPMPYEFDMRLAIFEGAAAIDKLPDAPQLDELIIPDDLVLTMDGAMWSVRR